MKKSIFKECPYLVVLIVIFWAGLSFSIIWNAVHHQLNIEYLKNHLATPFWENTYAIIDDAVRPPRVVEEQVEVVTEAVETAEEIMPTPEELPMPSEENVYTEGKTRFVEYEPLELDSPYYGDPGVYPITTDYQYIEILPEEMSDACFIGDSRTVGIYDYCDLEDIADFYCDTGYSLYDWDKGEKITYRRTGQKVDLLEEMSNHQYGKIYLMIGMNDLGYNTTEVFEERLTRLYQAIREQQPEATIYLMANMFMSREKTENDPVYNNVNINDKNVRMARLADGVHSFYLDENPLYVDDEGYLYQDYTFDGCHVFGNLYGPWKAFILSHVVK